MNTLAFISPGGGELLLVMLVLIMLFGAKDAPRILRKVQDFMDEVRRIANGFRYDMMYSDLHTDKKSSESEEIAEGDFAPYDFEEVDDAQSVIEDEELKEPNDASQKTDQ